MGGPVFSCEVDVGFAAANLARKDVLSKSDPFAVLCVQGPAGAWVEVGRTETVRDSQCPEWVQQVRVRYSFEVVQPLRVQLWDWDSSGSHDFLGEATLPLGRLMGSRGQTLVLPLSPSAGSTGGKPASVTLRGTEVSGSTDELRVAFSCRGLDRKDSIFLGGSSDPFIAVCRLRADGSAQRVWESAVIKRNLNPAWPEVGIPVQVLCNGDAGAALRVEVYDWDGDGGHDLIGVFDTSLNGLLEAGRTQAPFAVVSPKKAAAKKKGYTHSGTLSVGAGARVLSKPTLLQYLAGGLQINLMAAVDFTGSNGDPRSPASLHYVSPAGNEYLSALTSVGSILLEYDADKMVRARVCVRVWCTRAARRWKGRGGARWRGGDGGSLAHVISTHLKPTHFF